MIETKSKQLNVSQRIANAGAIAMSQESSPNKMQSYLEKVYGISTPQILANFSTYKDTWKKYIDIGN
ncbi:MAG: hypothetical protein EAZ27_01310 [Cytophagales bacterium]|nr:MAG: hypothetical protein EAZ27_01310 [Cytophagales bacterium]